MIAFVRSVPTVPDTLSTTRVGPLMRFVMLAEGIEPEAATLDQTQARFVATPTAPDLLGRYLAITSCTGCHGQDLKGRPARPLR